MMPHKFHLNLSAVLALSLLSSLLISTVHAGIFCSCPKSENKGNGRNFKKRQQQCQPNGSYRQYRSKRKHTKIRDVQKQSEDNVRQSNCPPEMCKKSQACTGTPKRVKKSKQNKCRRQHCRKSADCPKEVKELEGKSDSSESE
jgi:hypothetical protein